MSTSNYRRLQYLHVLPLLCSVLFTAIEAFACPVWKIGNLRVVDEKGKDILDAIIWRVYSPKDSFRLERGPQYFSAGTDNPDSSFFEIWSGSGYRRFNNASDKAVFTPYYRVHAAGYADVTINGLDFGKSDGGKEPTIKVQMYHAMYLKKGDEFLRIDQYSVDVARVVKDSVTIGLPEYTRALKQETAIQTIERKNSLRVKSYPNPATAFLQLEIRDSMPLPYRAELHDLNGRLMATNILTETNSRIDLAGLNAGMYMVSVRNHKGEMLYCTRFSKL